MCLRASNVFAHASVNWQKLSVALNTLEGSIGWKTQMCTELLGDWHYLLLFCTGMSHRAVLLISG